MAYKFLKSRQLRDLLDGAEVKQKKDIRDFSGGHLNESLLLQHYSACSRKSWETAHLPEPLVKRSQLIHGPRKDHIPQMGEALYEFSMGTTGVLPTPGRKTSKPSPIKRYKFLKEEKGKSVRKKSDGGDRPDSASTSTHSLYSELEDGILIEELPPAELMLKKTHKGAAAALSKMNTDPSLVTTEDTMYTAQTSVIGRQPQQLLDEVPFSYSFMTMAELGITCQDQYRKMKVFENRVLKKKEASERNVFSGVKAVEHHEKKLQEELEMLNLNGSGINFHKLQVHSNTLEDVIQESPTFSYILRSIKVEYDNYIAWLLDHQTSQHHLLRDQVEQMAMRGTSRPIEMNKAIANVQQLTHEAVKKLKLNQSLREAVAKEREWIENALETTTDVLPKTVSLLNRDQPLELADEIENLKAIILEKMDEENALRARLRDEFVPMTVCTHLEQCIKETEVEVQKLLKQNEYFERSIDEMETELKDAIQDADTSEKDARRIWRKVNSRRGLPIQEASGILKSDDEEEEEESKWNWYIS